ncbi:uncharacterized protein ANIA_11364 [Aspergillus nidulans FGSC A4]|uniref:Uncharacterized protein n=1 Tax=Emericella nidulans (strain FGSC A4 / ATCC 38163 / CBS 112.46 / NRRL 194 / M139) TaxID=227321 RepID=C8VJL8_EMENI|nr:hypothetical protein [Aspergillus nidulans FGSC A4]CBF84025.1 TPA: hypothetical protein ANIA_11364 [Aspergillus nidulans FGSC A4]
MAKKVEAEEDCREAKSILKIAASTAQKGSVEAWKPCLSTLFYLLKVIVTGYCYRAIDDGGPRIHRANLGAQY